MASTPALKWEPSALSFNVALNKPTVQELTAKNNSKSTYTFKVKTTNPKRYSVRPNVGIAWPGQEVKVSVQLPPMKDYPSDINKCKDKFQVLTLQLPLAEAQKLESMSPEDQRVELTTLWASDSAKEAAVEKIRCSMAFDSSFKGVPIAEEEQPITPYSPDAAAACADGAGASPVQTPHAEALSATPGRATGGAAPPAATAAADSTSASDLPALLASKERQLAELVTARDSARREAAEAMAKLQSKQASSSNASGVGGISVLTLLLFVLAAFATGLGAGQSGLLALPLGGRGASPAYPAKMKGGSKRAPEEL